MTNNFSPLSPSPRAGSQSMRRSLVILCGVFALFGLPWLLFSHLNDPLSSWEPLVRLHPQIEVIFQVILRTGEIAFLMLLIGGLPILFSALKAAFANRHRPILALFALSTVMLLVLLADTILTVSLPWWHSLDPNGGIFFLLFLLIGIVTVAQAVLRSEISERILRFALLPATILTAAMAIGFVATIIESLLLFAATRQFFTVSDTVNGIVAELMMAAAVGLALFALRRGFRARTLSAT